MKEINYLGIKNLCSKKFTVNLEFMKQKYFRSLNGIFGKVGLKTSPLVLISLINSYCVPNLLYCAESFWWSKSMLNSCENAYALAFMKVFRSYDKKIIEQCQYYMGKLPLELQIIQRQINFFANVNKSVHNNNCKLISINNDEYVNLCNTYKLSLTAGIFSKSRVKHELWSFFANKVSI